MNKYVVKYRFVNETGDRVWSIVNVEAENKFDAAAKAKEKINLKSYVIFDVMKAIV